ncbi:MAG: acyl-CoA reductase [Salibacteraceae bacterium]
MLDLPKRIEAFSRLGSWLKETLADKDSEQYLELEQIISKANIQNGWFTPKESLFALNYWATVLKADLLSDWLKSYSIKTHQQKEVLLILAGNIPLVGFHDVVSTILSGQKALIKCSSSDNVLIPLLLKKLVEFEGEMYSFYQLVNGPSKTFDAVIATGSGNSARHFEEYFGHVPNIIRRNRTSVALLDGSERSIDLDGLMEDAFRYYGLGCRNVSKLYLPKGYDLNDVFKASLPFAYLMDNKKYVNNYTYQKAVMMMEQKKILENELILMHENTAIFAPVSVLNYEFYENQDTINQQLEQNKHTIQCVVGKNHIPFGRAQQPALHDYADGVDTLELLVNL